MSSAEWSRLSADAIKPVTQGRVIKSEWIKLRSLRSTFWLVGAAMIAMVAFGLLIAFNSRNATLPVQGEDAQPWVVLQGFWLAMYLMGALGVVFVSGEYGTGMIRSTLTAVPRRLPVLGAKLVVVTGVVAVAMIAASLIAFVAAQGLISAYRPAFSLGDADALRVVVGTGVFLTLIALFGSALGWIFRSTPIALVTFFALVVALPTLLRLLGGSSGETISAYSPIVAGTSFIQPNGEAGSLSPLVGLLVLVAWVIIATVIGVWRLRSRDA